MSTADADARIADVWQRLGAAVGDRASPFRTPVVATSGRADAQVMVLRAINSARATLTFFSDVRADKMAAVAADPQVAIVAYDPAALLQVRLVGTATVASSGPVVEAHWAAVPPSARRAYSTALPPGTSLPNANFALAGDGRAGFAVLTVAIDAIDRLDLAGPDHVRVGSRRVAGRWHSGWRVP